MELTVESPRPTISDIAKLKNYTRLTCKWNFDGYSTKLPYLYQGADFLKDLKEPAPANQVEGFGQVHKRDEQWLLLLSTLLLQLTVGEDHVHGRSAGSKAALRLGVNA